MMKKIMLMLVLGAAVLQFPEIQAQKVKVVSGDLSQLKSQSEFNVNFSYDGMKVGKKDESVYVNEKTAEKNKSKAGEGDAWAAKWKEDRSARYQPKFIETLNKRLSKFSKKAGQNLSSAKYSFEVKIISIEPGWNLGFSRQKATTDMIISILDENKKEVIRISMDDCPPMNSFGGYDFDIGGRIAETFASAGDELGILLNKKAFK